MGVKEIVLASDPRLYLPTRAVGMQQSGYGQYLLELVRSEELADE